MSSTVRSSHAGSPPDNEWLVNQIAHALRNPIFAAMVQAEALVLRAGHQEGIANAATLVHKQLKRLEVDLEEMLLYGRPAKINRRRADLVTVARDVIEAAGSGILGEPARVSLSTADGTAEVHTDPDAVRVIIERLVSNAIQHTKAPHDIEIGIELPGAETVHVSVRDEGGGVSEEILGKMFLPFFPQHSGRPGLGLAVASKFAHALGGYIEIQTEQGEGTLARCVLPIGPPSSES